MLVLTFEFRRRVAPLGLVVGLSACTAEPDRIGPGEAELRVLVDEHCQSVSACACAGEVVEDGCTETLVDRWEARRAEAQRLGLRYDAECFDALHAQVQDYDCYWPGGPSPLCGSFCAAFHGDREPGESCEGLDHQASTCAQGLVCDQGACVEPCPVLGGRGQGETCFGETQGVFDDCAQGLGCSPLTFTCQPLAGPGQSCFDIECQPGLYCRWDQSDARCQAGATEGQPCDFESCAEGLYCEWQPNDQQICRAYAAAGESCAQRPCVDALWCDDRDVCVTAPREGDPCLWGSLCAQGYVCDPDFGACVTPPDAGAPCLQGDCNTGAWCDTREVPEGICAEALPDGEMCSGHRQCVSGFCPNGFCWAKPREGESCEGAGVCAAGLVCNGLSCEATTSRAPAACSYPGW